MGSAQFAYAAYNAEEGRGFVMSKPDQEREKFLSSLADKIKKPRPEPEKRDHLGNKIPKSRKGRQALTTWLNPAAIRQFKTLAFNHEKSQQASWRKP